MERTLHNRTLALAALFQCIGEVDRLARSGQSDPQTLDMLIRSVLKIDAPDLETIYGDSTALRPGLELLRQQLGDGPNPHSTKLMRYAVATLHLERRLDAQSAIRKQLGDGLEQAQRQSEYFDPTHDNVIAGLAALYRDTISKLGPRIIVRGEQVHLGNENIASRIRVLLLAAIRAAVLWRQAGGNRVRLLIGRRAMIDEAARLLA
ncbi:high frequency lysogenization protein HflD [Acidihalobacter ferrooxydans]|uniref:High frequency lysogenization protein HflD homolog n=1 Tax=Acidihalobacter ferrooxydans TaxID=1765967 RepID=A0A1P8UIJ7_9GAMM|nr:high frequency lysogenization protein HflD [Acidihalobacter ferrooxydans]APZ43658.1 lysogenization regulator HflD [Acidihalobacter ferrooxydans]